MKLTAIILSLIIIPVFLVVGYSSAKSNDPVNPLPEKNFAYFVEEIYPDGNVISHKGLSSSCKTDVIISDLGIEKFPEDKISIFPDAGLLIGGKITLLRAPLFNIVDGKKKFQVRSWQENVGGLLSEKNIALGEEDKINFSNEMETVDGMTIKIIRVAITTVVEKEAIDYKVVEREDSNLSYGKKRVEAGEKGERALTYLVRREDGEEVERTLLSSVIAREPKTQINYTGTKVTVLSSVRGKATMTPVSNYVVSANYRRGTLIRISANGKSIIETVNATWGAATPPSGVVLDLAPIFLSRLGCPSHGCSNVLVEEIQQ